jgi:iron complex outermembrane receptor protein
MKKSLLTAAAVLPLIAATAHAQTPSPSQPASAVTSDNAASGDAASRANLGDIVVTAQRRTEKLKDVPLTVSTLSSSDLAKAGVTSFSGLQNLVSGFTFSGFGTSPEPSIRGVSTTLSDAGSENPNALYIDGIYFGAQPILATAFGDIDRIEVLKGPQGTLFGRNATGGAIQIFTKQPSFNPHVSFTLEGSDYTGSGASHDAAHVSVRGFVTGPLIPGLLAASVSGAYNYTPGFYTNAVTGHSEGELSQANLRGKLLFTPADNLKITLGSYYVKNHDDQTFTEFAVDGLSAAAGYPGSVVASRPWQTLPGDRLTFENVKLFGGSARVELDTDAGTLTSLTGYNNFKLNAVAPFYAANAPDACFLSLACIDYGLQQREKELSQELNFASREFGILRFTTGLYYYNAKGGATGIIQQRFFPGGVLAQDDDFHTKSYAAYGEATLKPTESLTLIGGLRYSHEPIENGNELPATEHHGKSTFNSLTPRASITYALTPALNVYATFSRGFKSGNSGANNAAAPVPFAAIRPEKLTSYEAGFKFGSRDLTFNIAGYYYDYKNKQEQTFTGSSYFFTNTGPIRIYGLDADFNAHLTHEFSVSGTLSWVPKAKYLDFPNASGQSTVTVPFLPGGTCAPFGGCGGFLPGNGGTAAPVFNATGYRLIRAPRVTASGTLSYETTMMGGTFDASTTVSYSSAFELEITGTIRQSAYAAVSVQAGYKFADSGFRVGIFGRNITNNDYLVAGFSSAGGFFGTPTPPREVGLSVNYAY